MAVPLRLLNILFVYHDTARPMESRAIDQTRLKSLELFSGNDMIMDINDHR